MIPNYAGFLKEIKEFTEKLEKTKETSDPIDHPSHYNSLPAVCSECGQTIECIDVVRHMGFNLGNVVKYVWRAGFKESSTQLEDLKKAAWYLNDLIQQLEKEEKSE